MESGNGFRRRKQGLKPTETRESENKSAQRTAEEEPLSPSARLFHEPNYFNVYIIAIMGCKTRIYPDVVKANLGHTLLKHPRFSSLQMVDATLLFLLFLPFSLPFSSEPKEFRGKSKACSREKMESGNGLRWRKQAPKPIETRRSAKREEEKNKKIGQRTAEEEPLSPPSRLYHEPNFNVYVIAIMGWKTRFEPEVAEANLSHTLLKHPRFSSLQVVDEKNNGEMKWVRTEVDLERHVIAPELDPNMESPDKFLEDYIYNLTKATIDKSQPLWDLHLINLRTSESEAVGILRVHHSLGDGTSLISLLLACTRQINDPLALPTIPTKKKREEKNDHGGLWRIMFMFWSAFQVFWNTVVGVFMFLATVLFLTDTENPLKGRPGYKLTRRRIVYRTVSLDDIKLVKNAMNATVNDVAFGITQAGLSRYINRICGGNKKDGEATEMDKVPKNIRLRSNLLVNIRPSPGIHALADMMEKDAEAKWGNWVGFILLPVTIAIRDDPLDYVRDAKAINDRKKRSLEAISTFSIVGLTFKLFGVKALMVNFQSYIDKMSVVLSVDEETIPDTHQLCDDIAESLELIKNAVMTTALA